MTMCKSIKKTRVTFALTTILLILFIEEYYNKHKFSNKNENSDTFPKLLINHQQTSPQQLHPRKVQ